MLQDSATTTALSAYSRGSEEGELCSILRDKIMAYKRAHPRLSSQQIAKRFNMSSSTLGRIENQDIKTPTLEQVVKVLKGTGAIDELMEFMEKFYPDVSRSYKSYYEDIHVEKPHDGYSDYIIQPAYFKLLLIVVTGGATRDELVSNLGVSANEKLDFLINKGIVVFDEDYQVYCINTEKDGHIEIKINHVAECLKNAISSCYRTSQYQKAFNYLSFETWKADSVRVMPEICEIMNKARAEIRNVLEDPRNKGEDKIYFGFSSDVFFEKEVE